MKAQRCDPEPTVDDNNCKEKQSALPSVANSAQGYGRDTEIGGDVVLWYTLNDVGIHLQQFFVALAGIVPKIGEDYFL